MADPRRRFHVLVITSIVIAMLAIVTWTAAVQYSGAIGDASTPQPDAVHSYRMQMHGTPYYVKPEEGRLAKALVVAGAVLIVCTIASVGLTILEDRRNKAGSERK